MSLLSNIRKIKKALNWIMQSFPLAEDFGKCGNLSKIEPPLNGNLKSVYVDDFVKIRPQAMFICTSKEKVIIKKYTVLAPRCTIITNSHISTVSIPQILLGHSHINDKSGNVVINEDVWVGANVTILSGVTIGRGAVIAAGSLVTKSVPPYAVIAGIPAKIIKKKFTVEQILRHEKHLYAENERMSFIDLQENDSTFFNGMGVFGTDTGIKENELKVLSELKNLYKLDTYNVYDLPIKY